MPAKSSPAGVQDLRRAEQHGHVTVVPTRVHASGGLRGPVDVAVLGERQCVHVGAQHDATIVRTRRRPFDVHAHRRARVAELEAVDADASEVGGDQRLGFRCDEPELRVAVDRTSHRDDARVHARGLSQNRFGRQHKTGTVPF